MTATIVPVEVADADLFKGKYEHGTRPCYRAGCPCDACLAADRDYQQQRREARAPLNARISVTLSDTPPPGEWVELGACKRPEAQGVNFFPGRGDDTKAAKAVCAMCPVRRPCRDYGLSMPQNLNGIWGGLSGRERRAERKAQLEAQRHVEQERHDTEEYAA